MRILLAEDERSLSKAITAILTKNNFSVDPVYDGEEALRYMKTGEYDAAIFDIMMPKMDGITLLKTIRRSGDLTPVLMLTAKSTVDDKVEGLDSGANDYLTKPFDSKELLARLRAMTRVQATKGNNVLRFGDLTLDRTTCDLQGPTDTVKLSGKEYQMMEYLMNNPGILISADRFMDRFWGIDSDADISVVWTFLSYLRKKLQAIGSATVIRAYRGQGYALEEKDP